MKKIAYYFSFIPFQLNFFVLSFIIGCTYFFLEAEYLMNIEKTYFLMLLETLGLFVSVFALLIIGLAFVSTILSWVYFLLYNYSQKESPVVASIGEGATAQAGYVALGLNAKGILKPILGHIKGRIVFSDKKVSPALALDQPVFKNNKFIRSGLKAKRPVWVPDIKEHEVSMVVVYFEDMFRLFSFPYILSNVQQLLTVPAVSEKIEVNINPDKTIEQEQRIETPKRIQGELFNYKDFEAGDDIRRIVWKIYAKSKELVVKIPETMDPYASHIYFHPSFYNGTKIGEDIETAMLNYFKVRIRQVYEALQRTDFVIKYRPDQELNTAPEENEEQPVWLYQLSTSVWQQNKDSIDVITSKKEGIYCISSLIPFEEVEEMFTNKSPDTIVFFVKLSEMFKNRSVLNIFSLLIKTELHPLSALKRKWLFSTNRTKIKINEKRIQDFLEGQLFKNIVV